LSQLVSVNSCGFVKFVPWLPLAEGFRVFGVFRGQEDCPQPIFDALKR